MWKRKELKNKAKKVMHKNYWTILIVCFLIALLTGEFGTSILGIWQSNDSIDLDYRIHQMEKEETLSSQKDIRSKILKTIEANLNSVTKTQKYIFKIGDAITSFNIHQIPLGIFLCMSAVISFTFTVLVADPLIVGSKKYFLLARKKTTTNIGVIGEVFQKDYWLNVAMIMFLRNIYNALWYLTIIGGVIKTYEYRMIPYILAENPKIERKQAFQLSKEMMKGNKWATFVLDVSFFGWNFLSVLTFGILSILYVNPYNATTMAELYVVVKEKIMQKKDEKVK